MSEPIRAISLYQPYASLMALGAKTIETRPFQIHYRGDIAICSTATTKVSDLNEALAVDSVARTIKSGADAGVLQKEGDTIILPYGVVLAVVELYAVKLTVDIVAECLHCLEPDFGDYSPGRYGWLTRNLRRLESPVPVKGQQGIYYLPPDVWHFVEPQIKK